MTKEWNFLQKLVFNFGHELTSNPTQYMMEQAFAHHGLPWRYVQFEFGAEKLADTVRAKVVVDGRNCLDVARWLQAGWRVYALGRSIGEPSAA